MEDSPVSGYAAVVLASAAIAGSGNDNRPQSGDRGNHGYCLFSHIRAKSSRRWDGRMMRAVVIGGSLGGLTAALVLRDQGWEVDILERKPEAVEGRGTGIVVHHSTVRYRCAASRQIDWRHWPAGPQASVERGMVRYLLVYMCRTVARPGRPVPAYQPAVPSVGGPSIIPGGDGSPPRCSFGGA
jgi:hypothetical protein